MLSPVVFSRMSLYDRRQYPVGRYTVIVHLRAWRPFECEVADNLSEQFVVFPSRFGDFSRRESALVGDDVENCDVPLAVGGELGDEVGHPVVEPYSSINR